MRTKNIIGLFLFISFVVILSGCSVNTGISRLEKASSAIVKADGELTNISEMIKEHKNKPVSIKSIEKKLKGIEETIEETEKYKVDEKFAERHNRISERFDVVSKDFEGLKEEEEERIRKEKLEEEKEKEKKEKPEDSSGE